MMNWIVARDDLDGDVVHALLSILRDDRETLAQVHEMAGQINLEKLAEAPISLHTAVGSWR